MDKINFQNLPSTETPINADNLNQVQNNVESEIALITDFKILQNKNGMTVYKYGKLIIGVICFNPIGAVSAYTAIATIDNELKNKITLLNSEFPVAYRLSNATGAGGALAYFQGNEVLFPDEVQETVYNINGFFLGIYNG